MLEVDGISKTDHPEDLARTAAEVSHLHSFLAAVFRQEVNADFLEQLRSSEVCETLADAGVELGERLLEGPVEEVLEELAVEYTALFLGPGGHISPHESIYSEAETGNLMGEETVAVRNFIKALGFRYEDDYVGLPDHVSVELELMAELARREGVAWQEDNREEAIKCLEYQQEFMREHLTTWIGKFCKRVIEKGGEPLYREIARLTMDFVDSESTEIENRLKTARMTPVAA